MSHFSGGGSVLVLFKEKQAQSVEHNVEKWL